MAAIFAGFHTAEPLTLNDDLGACIGFRFQQNRVHMNARVSITCPGLQGLGAANFPAFDGDGGVIGHILRLKRTDGQPTFGKGTAQPCHQHGFADIRSRALHHHRFLLHGRKAH